MLETATSGSLEERFSMFCVALSSLGVAASFDYLKLNFISGFLPLVS